MLFRLVSRPHLWHPSAGRSESGGEAANKRRAGRTPMHTASCRRTIGPRRAAGIALALAGLLLATGSMAQAAGYPNKPIRIFVPYGPGGVGDLTVRILAQKLGDNVGQRFVIENRPGAGGTLAMKGVLDGPPDSYALGEMGNGQAIAMTLFTHLPYDVLKDFSPVSVAGSFPILIAVSGASPYHALKDVVEAAKKSPGKLNLGAINPGSTQNLSAHLFQQITGAQFTVIPYSTTPELVTALLRGDVDLGFDYYAGFISEIGGGKLRIVATSGEERGPLLKDIPTANEGGFPQYVVTSWNGVAGPAGLPDEIVQILNLQINRALAAPDLQQKARGLGIDARASTPQQMHDRMAADVAKWRDVIDKAGIPKQ